MQHMISVYWPMWELLSFGKTCAAFQVESSRVQNRRKYVSQTSTCICNSLAFWLNTVLHSLNTAVWCKAVCENHPITQYKLVHCFPICPQKSHASHLAQLGTHSKEYAEGICNSNTKLQSTGFGRGVKTLPSWFQSINTESQQVQFKS